MAAFMHCKVELLHEVILRGSTRGKITGTFKC